MSKIFTSLFVVAMSGCAGEHGLGIDEAQGRATTTESATSFTLVLAPGQTLKIASAVLSVQLVDVADSRCPVGAHCVWAGQATAQLLVSDAGAAPLTVMLGTPTPPDMKLPSQATVGAYKFSLTALEPHPTTQGATPGKGAKATILVEKILP